MYKNRDGLGSYLQFNIYIYNIYNIYNIVPFLSYCYNSRRCILLLQVRSSRRIILYCLLRSLNCRAFCILLVLDVAVVGVPLPFTTGNHLGFVRKRVSLALFHSSSTASTSGLTAKLCWVNLQFEPSMVDNQQPTLSVTRRG